MYSLIICELCGNSSITQLIKDSIKKIESLIDEIVVIKNDNDFIYNRSIKNAVNCAKNRDCIVVPSCIVPSENFYRYAINCYENNYDRLNLRAVLLGFHDNRGVSLEEFKNPVESYNLYTLYNNAPSENDYEYAFIISKDVVNLIPDGLSSHYGLKSLYNSLRQKNMSVASIVNERFCHIHDSASDEMLSLSKANDNKLAHQLQVEQKNPHSAEHKRFSVSYLNNHLTITMWGHSLKVKIKSLHEFPKQAVNYKEIKPVLNNGVSITKRACIFAGYTKNGLVSDNTLSYLKKLKEHCDYIVYVADSRILPDEVEKLKQCCDSILVNHHKEYDFGSYKRGFCILKDLNVLDKCESLLIANDSVDFVGNSEDLSDVFEKSSKYEAFGLCTASFGFGKRIKRHKYEWIKYPHLQSYFIVMKKDVFGTQWFADFMKSIIRIKRKRQIIIRYEMGLSGMLREHGVSMGSYYPYDETNIVNPYAIYLNEFTEKPLFIKHKVKCC